MARPLRSYEHDATVAKYWGQRHRLWSRCDEAELWMTPAAWFSVTPEAIAMRTAEICYAAATQQHSGEKRRVAIDVMCGCGGSAIALASYFDFVIGIDYDTASIEAATKNGAAYGRADKLFFLHADFFETSLTSIAMACGDSWPQGAVVDLVLVSPPWGGPHYQSQPSFDARHVMAVNGGRRLLRQCQALAANVAMFLPRQTTAATVLDLDASDLVACIQCFTNDRCKGTIWLWGPAAKLVAADDYLTVGTPRCVPVLPFHPPLTSKRRRE